MNEFRFGTLPDGWQKMPMRRCLLMRQNGSWGDEPIDDGDGEYCLRAADFDYPRLAFKGEENFVRRSYGPGAFENVHLKDGDILIEKSGGGEKTPVGRAILFDGSFTAGFSNFMERQRVNAQICVPEYYFYWWTAMYQQDVFTQYIKQTTGLQNLDTGTLLSQEYMPLPPLNEQEQIAKAVRSSLFDIQKTTDQLCAQISTLERYKSSLIHEAVTKGLDRDVLTRQSGVEWIGDIPEGWKIDKLKQRVYLRARLGWKGLTADEYVDDGYPMFSAYNIINNKLDQSFSDRITKSRYEESPEIMLSVGDVLLVKDGAGFGKCAYVDHLDNPSTVNGSIGVLTADKLLDGKYLYYQLLSDLFTYQEQSVVTGMGVPHLTQHFMANVLNG